MDLGKTIRRGIEPKPIEAPQFVPTKTSEKMPEMVPVKRERDD